MAWKDPERDVNYLANLTMHEIGCTGLFLGSVGVLEAVASIAIGIAF